MKLLIYFLILFTAGYIVLGLLDKQSNLFNSQIITNLISILILVITTYFLIQYTKETKRLADINANVYQLEIKKFNDTIEQRKPKLNVYFELNDKVIKDGFPDLITFVLVNEGNGSALNIKAKLDPPFNSSEIDDVNKQFSHYPLFKKDGMSDLPAKVKYKLDAGSCFMLKKPYIFSYNVHLQYNDENNILYNFERVISFEQFLTQNRLAKPNTVEVTLENIYKYLKENDKKI